MESTSECVECFLRQGDEASRFVIDDDCLREAAMAQLRSLLAGMDLRQLPVLLGQAVHRRLREISGSDDPYRAAKQRFNRLVADVLPELTRMVRQSPDPLLTAARLAIASNTIDLGSHGTLTPAEALTALRGFLDAPLHADLASFRAALDDASDVLYLTDNAGEIVADRLLIEQIGPQRVTVAVRGNAIINDATMEDARLTGLVDLVEVIDNGSDAPGTVLDDCSAAFCRRFEAADLVIAKGQGNYESLSGIARPIFFLFKVKCPVVARHAGLPLGTHALLSGVAGDAFTGHTPNRH